MAYPGKNRLEYFEFRYSVTVDTNVISLYRPGGKNNISKFDNVVLLFEKGIGIMAFFACRLCVFEDGSSKWRLNMF